MKDSRLIVIALAVVAALAALPLLYLLSLGPALWLVEHGCATTETFNAYFYPAERFVPIEGFWAHALSSYLSFWA